ncbi:zinc finger CCCH domain-containing protein 38 [Vigna unguiculata]|uniref:zinc finger CCCH domain-containing protein 38 n=1 Tax=Vigna unguiculata TaxID=3917 RepID=UPI001016DA21|nr:zinc finger CCCH domain-containing protein 38 [Vigna unguiculata]
MSESGRNTSSKLDSGDAPQFASYGTTSSNNSKSSHLERDDKLDPRMGFSKEESFSGGRGSNKDDIVSKDYRVSDAQNTDGSNKMELSPVKEDLENKDNESPETGCSRLVRSRSRSRSRSPRRRSRWDSITNDRYEMRAACRNFADGKCRRGSQCLFRHSDNQKSEDSRVSSRRQDGRCRMGASCNENSSKFNEASMDESSREMEIDRRCTGSSLKQSHGRNRTSEIPCKFYAFGNCRYGKHCRFLHDSKALWSPSRDFKDDLLRSSGGDQALDGPKSSDEVSLHGKIIDDTRGLDGSAAGAENKTGIMVDPEPGFNTLPVGDERDHSLDKNTVHGESSFSSDVKETKNDSSNVPTILPGNEKMSHNWNCGVRSPIPIKEEQEQSKQQVAPGNHVLDVSLVMPPCL